MTNNFLAGIPGYYKKPDGTWAYKQPEGNKLPLALLIRPLIARKPLTARELADELKTDIRVVRVTLTRMAARGYAFKVGKRWAGS